MTATSPMPPSVDPEYEFHVSKCSHDKLIMFEPRCGGIFVLTRDEALLVAISLDHYRVYAGQTRITLASGDDLIIRRLPSGLEIGSNFGFECSFCAFTAENTAKRLRAAANGP